LLCSKGPGFSYFFYQKIAGSRIYSNEDCFITASRPAANPCQFTKIPSNPLLISAQKQLMQAEEIRKRKESEKMVRRGDDEPDWQNVRI
jgi:hypothetical protein